MAQYSRVYKPELFAIDMAQYSRVLSVNTHVPVTERQ